MIVLEIFASAVALLVILGVLGFIGVGLSCIEAR
jgi:hypothetical protein